MRLRVAVLPEEDDVDSPRDLAALEARLGLQASRDAELAPQSAAILAEFSSAE